MADLDIIIVNWNTGEQLRACIASIAAADRRGIALRRVVVIDNASTDGSMDGLDRADLPLLCIRNDRNCGFAAACNRAAAASDAPYLLFLNPDTRLFADSLALPVLFLERPENEGIGLVGIRLVDEAGIATPSCSRFPTLATLLSKSIGLHRISRRLFPTYALPPGDHAESCEVDYVMGAFFLVRRRIFETLGGFDERFFMYFEEADLAKRMRERGWSSRYIAEAQAYHRGGGASERAAAERLFYVAASRILYARKHFGRLSSALFLAAALTLEPAVRIIASVFPSAGCAPRAAAGAYYRLYRALPRVLGGMSVGGEKA
jgi:N-acetylglucosaminyl-diphospho-decaprenol L-rhamnosyltransferase